VSVDEREFLLRSIRDLDAEWAAGDIDEDDYRSLRDEYTARAAAVLRGEPDPVEVSLEPEVADAAVGRAGRPSRRRNRTLMAVGGSLVVAGLAALLIASNVGHRSSGQTITGNSQVASGAAASGAAASGAAASGAAASGRDPRLDQAQQLFAKGKAVDAIRLYDAVLRDDPRNAEALAYEGWMIRLAGLSDQGLQKETAAETADPGYPDAHFFRGVILFEDKGDAADAVKELQFFLSDNPPPGAISRAEVELQKALQAGGPSVATTVDPRTNPSIARNFGPTTTP
jgi:tetratricopeptide (TPR) repeat protein